jgi:hypothetical protein
MKPALREFHNAVVNHHDVELAVAHRHGMPEPFA